jgi:hypothetical protein
MNVLLQSIIENATLETGFKEDLDFFATYANDLNEIETDKSSQFGSISGTSMKNPLVQTAMDITRSLKDRVFGSYTNKKKRDRNALESVVKYVHGGDMGLRDTYNLINDMRVKKAKTNPFDRSHGHAEGMQGNVLRNIGSKLDSPAQATITHILPSFPVTKSMNAGKSI